MSRSVRISAALVAMALTLSASAQTVLIPDEDLQVYLHSKCAACMDTVSGLMDVGMWNANPPSAVNIPLSIVQDAVLDLTGIDQLIIPFLSFDWSGGPGPAVIFPAYPAGLQGMSVDAVDFAQFPDVATLTPAFKSFGCLYCGITDIPSFQTPMEFFNIFGADLNSGANVVPSTVTELILQSCQISICHLPPVMQDPTMTDNFISSIPQFPDSLLSISLDGNQLTALPPLPETLITLSVRTNPITTLPPLPDGLHDLIVGGTALAAPFTSLPSGLLVFYAYDLSTDVTPPVLPAGLQYMAVANTPVSSLPALPPALLNLNVSNTPQLACLPLLPNGLVQLYAQDAGFNCLPNAVIRATPGNLLTASDDAGRFVMPASVAY